MSEMRQPSTQGGEPETTGRGMGGMWPMWLCCIAILLFLILSFFRR